MTATEAHELRESAGRKTIRKHQLSSSEVESIIRSYQTKKQTQKEVASVFGVSERLVSSLVVASKKDP